MKIIADLHIHSKYSRATSKIMDIESLSYWARLKGINLLGTGDFTHEIWLNELKRLLEPTGDGLFVHKGIHFMLTAEISSIYSKNGRCYRIHNLIFAPSFKTVDAINRRLSRIGNLASDGRPILGLDAAELCRIVFSIDENCMVVPAHVWTPWFSLFGSMSGFDALEDCFEEQSENIHCLETGLSSDPAMNWRVSSLDRLTLISNSDSHSPQRIGREANVLDCELTYAGVTDVLKSKDKKRFLYTVEFYPEEGKYHYDGHRNCGIRFTPQETARHKGLCPKCGKKVTVGVLNRVDCLADREEGIVPKNSIPFRNSIPLDEIVGEAMGRGCKTKGVQAAYMKLIADFGNEFALLQDVDEADIRRLAPTRIGEAIIRTRRGILDIQPGYDGEYGKISIFKDQEDAQNNPTLF